MNKWSVANGYDKAWQTISIAYGSLGSLTYAYDSDGRRTGVSSSLAASSIPGPQTFTYNADSSLAKSNNTTSSGSASSLFEFAGRENDTALVPYPGGALYYMRGRYYDPQIARFISRDPAGLAGGLNLYAYAGDDPVDFSDPTGMGLDSSLEGPGDVCAACIDRPQGGFEYQGLPLLGNQNGLDRAVVPFYRGQNGGRIEAAEIILARYFIPFSSLPEDPNEPPGEGWVRRGPNWWNPHTGQSLHHDPQHPPPKGPDYDLHNRYPTRWKLRIRPRGPAVEFWSEDLQEWLPIELLPVE